jgi:hypothetical protein
LNHDRERAHELLKFGIEHAECRGRIFSRRLCNDLTDELQHVKRTEMERDVGLRMLGASDGR